MSGDILVGPPIFALFSLIKESKLDAEEQCGSTLDGLHCCSHAAIQYLAKVWLGKADDAAVTSLAAFSL